MATCKHIKNSEDLLESFFALKLHLLNFCSAFSQEGNLWLKIGKRILIILCTFRHQKHADKLMPDIIEFAIKIVTQNADISVSRVSREIREMAAKLRLEGKVAVITGGASGIGEASARLFVAQGASVVIADIQDSLGQSVAASISPSGAATYIHCDVRDELQVAAAVALAVDTYGRIDVMFSNAGIVGSMASVLDLELADLDLVLAVHVRGAAAAIKHAGRAMVAAGTAGSIICTASVAAVQAGYSPAAYAAAKHAIHGLMKAAAGELGEKGVRVNCVSPFGLATPLMCGGMGLSPEVVEKLSCEAAVLKGAVLRTGDVAAAALFLASDESAFISGHNLVVDGATTVVGTSLGAALQNHFAGGRG